MDVLIPSIKRDKEILEGCIRGVRRYCHGVERVIVASPAPLTENAEWLPETRFPFTKRDVKEYLRHIRSQYADRAGWFFQQCLKLYALRVVPDLSDRVLLVDSDVIWFRKVDFFNKEAKKVFFNIGVDSDNRYNSSINSILGLRDRYPHCNGVAHHMVFERDVMESLFHDIETRFDKPFWQVAMDFNICFSEWNVYFKYALNRFPERSVIRPLLFESCGSLDEVHSPNPAYVALQAHRRKGWKARWKNVRAYKWPPSFYPGNLRSVGKYEAVVFDRVHRYRFFIRNFLEWVRHLKNRAVKGLRYASQRAGA